MTQKNHTQQVRRASWIKFFIATLLCLLFVIWSGYWLCLILLPLLFDIYITQYLPWGAWRKIKNPFIRKICEWIDAVLFALVAVYFINTFFFQNYQIPTSSLEKSLLVGDFLCVSKMSYGTRSPITPLSLPLAQHTIPFLNIKSYIEKPQVAYKRFWGGGKVKLNDIVVFNYPSGDTVALNRQQEDYYILCKQFGRNTLHNNPKEFGNIVYRPVDRRENYVKRCVGLPGNTLQIIDDQVFINDERIKSPSQMELSYFVQTDGTPITPKEFDALGISVDDYLIADQYGNVSTRGWMLNPSDSIRLLQMGFVMHNGVFGLAYQLPLTQDMMQQLKKKPYVTHIFKDNNDFGYYYPIDYPTGWNRSNYGPIWIPQKGETIDFTTDTALKIALYKRCIENYEGNTLTYIDNQVMINGKATNSYTFQLDYYFMMGDNRDNSADSRTWGFVPEDHIVGKPMFIWLSLNKDKGWFDGRIRWDRLFTNANKQ